MRPTEVSGMAAGFARAAFFLAGYPFLLLTTAALVEGLPAPAVLGTAVLAFVLLAWPLNVRTNRGLILAETVSGGVFLIVFLACGFLLIPYVGVLILVPFLPAMCAAVVAMTVATGRILREEVP